MGQLPAVSHGWTTSEVEVRQAAMPTQELTSMDAFACRDKTLWPYAIQK